MKRNSASVRLTNGYVAHCIAGRGNPELQTELLKHPKILEAKRQQIILNRIIKNDDTKTDKRKAPKHDREKL